MSADSTARTTAAAARMGLDPARLSAWRGFIAAHAHVLGHLAQELDDEEGLPLTWYDVLVQLSEADDHRLRMHDLAGRVLVSQSGLTRLVDRMEDAGLIERVRCAEDGRGLFAVLTDSGLETLRRTYPTHLRGVRTWFADLLSDEEAVLLAGVLERIAENACGEAVSSAPEASDAA